MLEAWRLVAGDPDHRVYKWLRDGAPAGITEVIKDPGIFPACPRPAELQPEDIYCDEQQFRNYPGVEEQEITDAELSAHLDKGHLCAFDTHKELAKSVGPARPTLNQLGLIVKTCNGITKARMILDTKQSGVKRITSQAQRVTTTAL